MYFAHPTTKLPKLTGTKGHIERWNIDNEHVQVERITMQGGKDTLSPVRYDRHVYIIKGAGQIELDEELLLSEGDLVKIPKSKLAVMDYSQFQYLVIKGDITPAQTFSAGSILSADNGIRLFYILDGNGFLVINGKTLEFKSNTLLALQNGETASILSGKLQALTICETSKQKVTV